MKKTKLFRLLPAVVLLMLALGWTRPLALAQQDGDPAAPSAQQQEQPQPYNSVAKESDVKTFTGMVTKSGEQLVLKNNAAKTTYKLDDQDRAKSFEGKNVKVKGALDASTGTIRVNSIELEPES